MHTAARAALSSIVRAHLKALHYILLSSIALLAVSSAGRSAAPNKAVESVESRAAECTSRGGTIKKVCRLQQPWCVVSYSDAGKRCTDKSQCKGRCILDSKVHVEIGEKAEGRCEPDDDPCGCKPEVIDGKFAGGQCID